MGRQPGNTVALVGWEPVMEWVDCVKRDVRKAEEEENWREKTNNRDQWK